MIKSCRTGLLRGGRSLRDFYTLSRQDHPLLSSRWSAHAEFCLWLLWEEEGDLEAHAPGGCAGGMDGVAVEVCRDVDRLDAETHDTADASAKGDGPSASWRGVISVSGVAVGLVVPVCRDDWAAVYVPALLQVVGDEVLQGHLVYRRAMRRTCDRPDVVDEKAEGPVPRLNESDNRWAKLNFPCPRTVLVAVGKTIAGPTPQMIFPGLAGERKKVGLMSPMPYSPPVTCLL